MALDETDLDALVSEAAVILDEAAKPFVSGHGADSAVQKKGNDFATEVDLAIERQVVDALVSRTGIEVHGEEFGGADVDSPLVWVLDPIDGTINYAAGLPTAAILLALVRDGEPVAGLTWLPFTDQRFTAVIGKPLYANGVAQPPLEPATLADSVVGTSTFDIDSRGRFPGRYRIAILERLEPGVLADADARRDRPRHGLHRSRNPRCRTELRRPRLGPRGRCRAGAGRRRHRHRSGRQATGPSDPRVRWPDRPACTARFSRSCGRSGDPEDY